MPQKAYLSRLSWEKKKSNPQSIYQGLTNVKLLKLARSRYCEKQSSLKSFQWKKLLVERKKLQVDVSSSTYSH